MGRPREFDADTAVDHAMDVFWRRGYEATSVVDLTEELGVGKGSLYAAFGSKDELYALALERYCSVYAGGLVEVLSTTDDVRGAVRSTLLTLATQDAEDPDRGCLLVNAVTERAGDGRTTARVDGALRALESALAGALHRARAEGDLASEKDPVAIARFLITFLQGLRVMGQARARPDVVRDALEVALRVLD